jgi:thioredoxin-dependent peroxiredoxin
MLKIGDRIPEFELTTDSGKQVSTRTLKGKPCVLYFYPKDDTPGCTREACAFRDALPAFDARKLHVYGISADDEKRHARFAAKFALNFPLIADPEHVLINGFGVWVEKSLYGRKYMGIARASFAIDAQGKVLQVWDKVKPDTHAAEVLAWFDKSAATAAPLAKKRAAAAKSVGASKPATPKTKPRSSARNPARRG